MFTSSESTGKYLVNYAVVNLMGAILGAAIGLGLWISTCLVFKLPLPF